MKMRYILIVIAMLSPFTSMAQSNYRICEIQGKVAVKSSGQASWNAAQRYASVESSDSIRLENNSHIRILDTITRRVYFYDGNGIVTVDELVKNDETKSNRLFTEINKTVFGQQRTPAYKTTASTTRLPGNNSNIYQALYAHLRYCATHTELLTSETVAIESVNLEHGTFGIKVTNLSSDTLYCNMVNLSDGHMQLCYFFDVEIDLIRIAPGSTTDLTPYPLYADSRYLFFATKEDMSVLTLNVLFEAAPDILAIDPDYIGFDVVVVRP